MREKTLKTLEFNKIIDKLASFATSKLGKEKVEKLLPAQDINKIKYMLKETDDGLCYIFRRGNPPLGGIRDIERSIKRVEMGAVLTPRELLNIGDVLRSCRYLKNHASGDKKTSEEKSIVLDLIDNLKTNRKIEDRIKITIIGEEEVADDASPTLKTIRRQIKDQQESIKERLNGIIRSPRYQKYIQESLVTIRGGRYVIPVKQECRNEVSGLVHDSSASGATIFIEPMAVVEANNYIKQLKIKEQVEIEKILAELTVDISMILDSLTSNIYLLARLDFIFAKAKLSIHYNCTLPKLNEEGYINIRQGRHPLLNSENVVPIDFWMGGKTSTLVITGPNTGGKTVTLKTVGLLTLMAQAGLHIPAGDNTEVGVFNNIFADIGDEQSIEQNLSTFSSHMTNIIKILKSADRKSLVLLDELGAGTDPTEGAALAMSILQYLHQKDSVTVATTHYSELKVYAITKEYAENASLEFDIETLKPTFKLLIGVPGKSNAFAISKRLGLEDKILNEAKEFLTQEDLRFEDLLLSIEKDRINAEEEKVRALIYRQEIEKLKDELEKERNKIKEEKDRIVKDAKEESRRLLENTKKESEAFIKELRDLEKEEDTAKKNRAIEKIRSSIGNKINTIDESLLEPLMPKGEYVLPLENIKAGDSVLITNLNQKGIVIEPPDNNKEAIIQAGIIKINVHMSNLKLIDEQKIQIAKTGIGKIGKNKAMEISPKLDLRGLTIDEASINVDKYLDDASITGLKTVMLIHGKGTGALRAGIQNHIKNHIYVKTSRLGAPGEGGDGVTVVELK
jgi:DNA mismatch repair protein MutS2